MAFITWGHVTSFASGLSSVDVNAQIDILNYVNNVHDVSLFGGEDGYTLRMLRILLAAHLASSTANSSGTGSSGLVASESVGGISRSYLYPDLASGTALQATAFGREYSAMLAGTGARVGVAF